MVILVALSANPLTAGRGTLTGTECAIGHVQETLQDQMAGKGHVSDAVAKEVSSALVMAALRKGTLDNVTVVVLLLRWD